MVTANTQTKIGADMNIGRSIKIANAMQGKTQEDLAEYLGLNPATVSRICKGKAGTKTGVLAKMAAFYGMKVSEFIALGEQ